MSEKLVLRSEGKNTYRVFYSEFKGGDVIVRRDGEKISEVTFEFPKKPLTAHHLREFPLKAVETLIDNGVNSPSFVRPKIAPPKGRMDDDFFRQVRAFYLDALARNERPLVAMAQHSGAPHNTVARWVARARQEGYLK